MNSLEHTAYIALGTDPEIYQGGWLYIYTYI